MLQSVVKLISIRWLFSEESTPTATRISGWRPWAIAIIVVVVLKAAITVTDRATVIIITEASIDFINEFITLVNFILHQNFCRFCRLIKAYFIDFKLGIAISFQATTTSSGLAGFIIIKPT